MGRASAHAKVAVAVLALFGVAACQPKVEDKRAETARAFPLADRPVSKVVSSQFSTEADRDRQGEANMVMDLAGVKPGMSVADIGAGEGYYTVRLAERVGPGGRVLAQDIDGDALRRLGLRVEKDRLDNVSIKPGAEDDPRLPERSFDRIFMVHMYHEVTEPYAFLWNMWPALNAGGQIIVVESDRPVGSHGLPHTVLFCEFEAVGYVLVEYIERPDIKGYFARFERGPKRTEPDAIRVCDAG